MKTKMSREATIDLIDDIATEVGGDVRESYSGRGMYGETCYGIVCDNANRCLELAGAAGLLGGKVDSMGRQMIVYWPNVRGEACN